VLALVVVALVLVLGTTTSGFFSLANLYDISKSMVVTGIFAIGAMIVLASGGIDISFTAVAAFSMYVTCRILVAFEFTGSVAVAFALAAGIGALLGLFNAAFIALLRLPTLIVTLGTASLFRGFLLAFIGTSLINSLPPGMVELSRWTLTSDTLPSGETIGLSGTVLFLVAVAIGTATFLRYTVLGRGVNALGGHPAAAARIGFPVRRLQFFVYGFVGGLSGIAGILHASMMRNADPRDLVGTELDVIAAVVLGGASITGGRGTVLGTLLGVALLQLVYGSLIQLHIPSYWQRVAVGLAIVVSTWISAMRGRGARGAETSGVEAA